MRPIATPDASDDALRARFDDAARPAAARDEIDWYVAPSATRRGAVPRRDVRLGSPARAAAGARHGDPGRRRIRRRARARRGASRGRGRTTTLYRQSLPALNLPTRYAAAILDGSAFARIADPVAARLALERLRMHLIGPGVLIVDARVPPYAGSRYGAPLVEMKSVALDDGSKIRMRSETSVDADARLARTDARYTHRHGARALAEAHARGAVTWYAGSELAELLVEAGWRDIAEVASPGAIDDGETGYALTARV